jgi:hypothetical protein
MKVATLLFVISILLCSPSSRNNVCFCCYCGYGLAALQLGTVVNCVPCLFVLLLLWLWLATLQSVLLLICVASLFVLLLLWL